MESAAEHPSIIEEYSQLFTGLQAGKRELIQYGADAVSLNRYIVDAAGATESIDDSAALQDIDVSKVPHGDTDNERSVYCRTALGRLVSCQEQIAVLQKSAREMGISGGLLTIVGQAASQSPEDNGASVLRQLSELVGCEDTQKPDTASLEQNDSLSLEGNAANDLGPSDAVQTRGLPLLLSTIKNHWRPLAVDAVVSAIAACIAISLIN